MSWQAVECVLKHSRSRGATRLVAVSIANHADSVFGKARLSAETISREANILRSSVFSCLDGLEELRELERESGAGCKKVNEYRLVLFARQSSLFDNGQQTAAEYQNGRQCRRFQNVQNGRIHPSEWSAPPDRNHKELNIERVCVGSKSLADWIPIGPWRGYVDMRREIRRPLTAYAIDLAIRDLAALKAEGNDPAEVLEEASADLLMRAHWMF